jgi:hypothetical protein
MEMMLAHNSNRTGLRTSIAFFFSKTNLLSDFESIESGIDRAILMKVNFMTISSFDESIPPVRE